MPEIPASFQDSADQIQAAVFKLCRLWNVEEIQGEIKVEFCGRLTRSLGRTLSSQKTIRLNMELCTTLKDYLDEVICHELAHVVTVHQHGPSSRPHGEEWRNLVRLAGYEPSVRMQVNGQVPPRKVPKKYKHYCPVCHLQRISRTKITRWRCSECVANGLTGQLQTEEMA